MDSEIRCLTATSRRETLVRGSKFAAVLSLFAAGFSIGPVEAKKKKKKKKKTFNFKADPMTGANEVPGPGGGVNDPLGSGSATFRIKGNQICGTFNFTTTTPNSTVTGTHIHQAPVGSNGPIVIDFQVATIGVEKCLTCTGGGSCDPGFLGQIKANPSGFYANIHTSAFPNGAVRGQLVKG
jgi:hypothetical protein